MKSSFIFLGLLGSIPVFFFSVLDSILSKFFFYDDIKKRIVKLPHMLGNVSIGCEVIDKEFLTLEDGYFILLLYDSVLFLAEVQWNSYFIFAPPIKQTCFS